MITKGLCETGKHATPDYAPQYGVYIHNENNDFCIVRRKNAKDDADFIVDAFNTYNETGLTPSQLAEHRKDLLAACKVAETFIQGCLQLDIKYHSFNSDADIGMFKVITDAIAKAEAVV